MNTKKNVTDKTAAMTSATEPTRQERTNQRTFSGAATLPIQSLRKYAGKSTALL
jgi:hypothetical protein